MNSLTYVLLTQPSLPNSQSNHVLLMEHLFMSNFSITSRLPPAYELFDDYFLNNLEEEHPN